MLYEPSRAIVEEENQPPARIPGSVLLRANGLQKSFGHQTVLANVDLTLREGEVVLLGGENGSGKTTLLNILTGNLEPDAGKIEYLAGREPRTYRFPRRWHEAVNPWDHFRPEFVARAGIGRTWQDLRLFASQSVLNNIEIALPNQQDENPFGAFFGKRQGSSERQASNHRALRLLDSLGLTGREQDSPGMLSYGQTKRTAIGRAVAAESKVLFLDEPLAGLDHSGISDLLDLLRSLVERNRMTLVIVEHVLSQLPLKSMLTTSWSLDRGRITTTAYSPVLNSKARHDSWPSWLQSLGVGDCQIVEEELPRGAILSRIRPAGTTTQTAKPTLELRDLVIHRASRLLWGREGTGQAEGVSLSLQSGEIAVLRAPNGWGKTTLLKAIAGLHPISSGSIHLLNEDVTACKPWERIKAGLRVALGSSYLFDDLTVRETLLLAETPWPFDASESFLSMRSNELSGGQRGLLALVGSTQSPGHRVMLLDEPFSMLDSLNVERASSLMRPKADSSLLITLPLTVH